MGGAKGGGGSKERGRESRWGGGGIGEGEGGGVSSLECGRLHGRPPARLNCGRVIEWTIECMTDCREMFKLSMSRVAPPSHSHNQSRDGVEERNEVSE